MPATVSVVSIITMKSTEVVRQLATTVNEECHYLLTDTSNNVAGYESTASKGRLLVSILGVFGRHWQEAFAFYTPPKVQMTILTSGGPSEERIPKSVIQRMHGASKAILDALDQGYLVTLEETVSAELLGDLRDHAKALLEATFYLAACVVARAILEERLRLLCSSRRCMPTRDKPGIEDFNQELYRQGKTAPASDYNKTTMQWVTAMAGVGNTAAHNLRPMLKDETERLLRDVDDFLRKFSP